MRIERVHCTLIYLGEEGKVHVPKGPVEAAVARLNSQVNGANVRVKDVEVYGNGHCTVLTLESWLLKSWRKFIETELRRDGIVSASEWAYQPHITINKHDKSEWPIYPWVPFQVPTQVWVDNPVLWWGSDGKIR
jgi:2'-5' RNA ligase